MPGPEPERSPEQGIPGGGRPDADPPSVAGFGAGIVPEAAAEPTSARDRAIARRAAALDSVTGAVRTLAREARRAAGPVDLARLRPLVERAVSRYEGPMRPGEPGAALQRALDDGALRAAPVYARRVHWAEDPARVLADLAVASRAGAALGLLPPPLDDWYGAALEELEDASGHTLRVEATPHLDALRRLAEMREVAVDAFSPDGGLSGLGPKLEALREAAAETEPEPEPAQDDESDDGGWFGAGVVESPAAPLRAGPPAHGTILVGVEEVTDGRGEVRSVTVDGSDGDALRRAAAEVAELAFGADRLGGLSLEAWSRVVVRPTLFSAFTEELLEVLEEGFEDGSLGAPSWATERPDRLSLASDASILAARKVGLDEGATLVFERARSGRRALVFTNVEPRMALSRSLRAPCVLGLERGPLS